MRGVAKRNIARHDHWGDGAQPGDDRARFVEPPHMGITGSKSAMRLREARIFLDCEEQFWDCFIEAAAEKMRGAY